MFEYRAIIDRVIDGDTIVAKIDLGFDIWSIQTLRLSRIDAYETRLSSKTTQEQKELGLQGFKGR